MSRRLTAAEHEHRREGDELDQQQPAVARAEQARRRCRPAPTCSRARRPASTHHQRQRRAREAPRGEHRVGPRVGAARRARPARAAAPAPAARRPRRRPRRGARRRRRWRRAVPGSTAAAWPAGGDQASATRAQQRDLAAHRPPVGAVADLERGRRGRRRAARAGRRAPARRCRPASAGACARSRAARSAAPARPSRTRRLVGDRDERRWRARRGRAPRQAVRTHDSQRRAVGRSDGPASSSRAAPPTRKIDDARCSQRARSPTTSPTRSSLPRRGRSGRPPPASARSAGLPMATVIFLVASRAGSTSAP